MLAMTGEECVVCVTVHGVRENCALTIGSRRRAKPKITAPSVRTLQAHAGSWPEAHLCLKRVVIRMSEVGLQSGIAQLRICLDEVFRQIVEAKHRAGKTGGSHGHPGIVQRVDGKRVQSV